MRSRCFWVWPALLVAAVLGLLLLDRPANAPKGRATGPSAGAPSAPATGPGAPAAGSASGTEEPSRLADRLNAPGGDIRTDLRIVDQILIAYRSALRTGNPVGENAEITAALRGGNRLGFAFIPAGHPAINAKGELCDRWGTPFFFHQISGEKMEIRSAGPDRALWTADDAVFTP
jgi:hypothetical protein